MKNLYSATAATLKNAFDMHFHRQARQIPQTAEVEKIFDIFKDLLFQYPFAAHQNTTPALLKNATKRLEKQLLHALCFTCEKKTDCSLCKQEAKATANAFVVALPAIQELVITDVTAAFEGDPAAQHPLEPLLCYPGLRAVALQRMAHFLYQKGVQFIPRIVTEYAHRQTGIDIHPGASIGPAFFIDHGTGVVIGETCTLGANVKLYQGVTLGAKSFPLDANGHPVKGIKRHPNIGNHVIIYAETTILGNISIGDHCIVGANQWVTKDVPPHTQVH